MKKLLLVLGNIVKRLDSRGDTTITAADLANIIEQEALALEMSAEEPQ